MTYSLLRLRVAGAAAVAAIALSVLQVLLTPAHLDGSTREMVAAASSHPTAAYAAGWCEMLWGLCAALACITVTGLVRSGRGSRLTAAGGWMNTISLLSLGFSTLAVSQAAIAARAPGSVAVRAIDAMNGSPGLVPVLVLLLLGLLFPIVLAVGLARAGLVGWWYVGVAVLGAVFFIGLTDASSVPLRLLAVVPTAVTWAVWAMLLTRASDVPASTTRVSEPLTV
jgi:hypothetical protein